MQEFLEDSLVIMTKSTIDAFLNTDCYAELIGLYSFYYYTAKWQKTNQPKCTTDYVAKGIGWNVAKVRKYKQKLIDLGLVEDVVTKDDKGKVTGHYIKLKYVVSSQKVSELYAQNPPHQKSTGWVSPRVAKSGDKCLKNKYNKCLKKNNKMLKGDGTKKLEW